MMTNHAFAAPSRTPVQRNVQGKSPRELYDALRAERRDTHTIPLARAFLKEQLDAASFLECDLPDDPESLASWLETNVSQVGEQYRRYREVRAQGAPRRYFANRAHAGYFLRAIAPTKLVDGAWLYGLLQHWSDARFLPLIRTYLEELGNGEAEKNHVVLYQRLLASVGGEDGEGLRDEHFIQGAIQLCLARLADDFLPEVVGFNLGYEQLPLHLLITAYELNELGIDPYYFTLHVTVDNAASGHARKAQQALAALLPSGQGRDAFWRRVRRGYRLNLLGASAESVAAEFDLNDEVVAILTRKSSVGQYLHSDYCRIDGLTVNQWLGDPERIPEFLAALERRGWIKRGRPAQESRFWRLIEGERAEMFGVFTEYETQVLHDWIADQGDGSATATRAGTGSPEGRTFRQQLRQRTAAADVEPKAAVHPPVRSVEESLLETRLGSCPDRESMMDELVSLLSPARHHRPDGLLATRLFVAALDGV